MQNSFNLALRNLKKNGLEARRSEAHADMRRGAQRQIYIIFQPVIKVQEVPLINILFESLCGLHGA